MNENSPGIRWLNGLSGRSECQASATYLMRSSRRRRSQGAHTQLSSFKGGFLTHHP